VVEQAKQAVVANQTVDLMPPGTNAPSATPAVFVSTVPAELIQSEGPANLVPIEGTQLMQVQNSDDALFFYDPNQRYYVLISGRWFDASSLRGPWGFVPYNELPKDFAKIPPTHPKANALVSVPGTPQANEAVIANSIPQTATVQRTTANLELAYDGAPQFSPIAGTPLLYAINTTTPVIEVDARTYYSVQNGIWFVATSPSGPWVVATSVPAVIYTIPVNSPLHYVTYAQIYGYTPDEVYVGLHTGLPGHGGMPGPCRGLWHGPTIIRRISGTTGWANLARMDLGRASPITGMWDSALDLGRGAWLGTWCHPWWGPYGWGWHHHYHYNHVSLNHINIYNHWGPGIVHAQHNYGFNAWNGREWSHNWSTHFSPYSGRGLDHAGAGRAGGYDGNFHAHGPETSGTPHQSEQHDITVAEMAVCNRHSPAGTWERNSGSSWQRAPEAPRSGLEQHAFGNSMGDQRFNNFRSYGGGFGHVGGGGEARGGHSGGGGGGFGGGMGGGHGGGGGHR